MIGATVTTYLTRVRHFGPNARLYLLYLALSGILTGVFSLLLNFYILGLGHDELLLGRLLAATNTAALLGALPAGYLSDRLGRRNALLLAAAGSTLSLVGLVAARQTAVFYLVFILMGLAQSLGAVTMAPFLVENSGEQERTYLFSVSFGLQMLTVTIGYWLGGRLPGWLAQWRGPETADSAAYGWSLAIIAGGSLLTLIPLLFLRSAAGQKTGDPLAPLRYAWQMPKLLGKFILPILITTAGAGLFVPFMNIFFRQAHHSSDATIGSLFAAGSLAMGLGLFAAAPWAERYGQVRVFILSQALSIPFMALLGFAPWFWVSVLAYLLRILLMNMAIPVYQAFVMEQVEQEARGLVAALLSMGYSFGYAVSPAISGRLQVQFGFAPIFAIAITSYAIAILLYWRFFWRTSAVPAPAPL